MPVYFHPSPLIMIYESENMSLFDDIAAAGKVVPVLSFNNQDEALKTCQTLGEAGMRVFEITLRNSQALDILAACVKHLPADSLIGAGTILTTEKLQAVIEIGAHFGVSPGLSGNLVRAIMQNSLPMIPGVATVSEAMQAQDHGFQMLKLFPAEQVGGAKLLGAMKAVLPNLNFMPTGGLNPDNAGAYLALSNVPVVGGSWIVKRDKDGIINQEQTFEAAKAAMTL